MSEVNIFQTHFEDTWQCRICTFLNSSVSRYCNTCQGWRFEHIFSEGSPSAMDQTSVQLPSTNSSSIPLFLLPPFPDSPVSEDNQSSSPTRGSSRNLRLSSSPLLSSPCIERVYSPPPPLPPTDPVESVTEALSDRCPKPDAGVKILELPWDLELLYDRGRTLLMKISVRRNSKKAWELLQLAASRGHPAAQWDLFLRKPDSDEIDWDKAVEYYVTQMQIGGSNGLMEPGFDHGAIAAFCLGCCFLGGWGVERREDRAVALYKIAVKRGYIKGLNEVGWIYDHGLGGVAQDSVSAFQCFKLLANRGYALAQYNTGRCFRDGRGVDTDWKEAVEWLMRASEQGYHNAQRSLGSMFQVGDGAPLVVNGQGLALPRLSTGPIAVRGENNGKDLNGKVKKDIIRALILYRDSASNGDPAGVHKIQEMTSNTRVTYRGSSVFKEPVSYFMEVKIRQRKQHTVHQATTSRSALVSSNERNGKQCTEQLNNKGINNRALNSNNVFAAATSTGSSSNSSSGNSNNNSSNNVNNSSTNNTTNNKKEEKKGEYWVPKLIDQCCLVLSRLSREVWEDANIPATIKCKLDHETTQCSAGCGGVFYGKGRVTRTFVYMKLVNSNGGRSTSEEAKFRGNGGEYYIGTWRDFGATSETTAVWRDTRKIVTMPFCSGECAEGFLQRSYWDF